MFKLFLCLKFKVRIYSKCGSLKYEKEVKVAEVESRRFPGGAMHPVEEVRQGESQMYKVGNFTIQQTSRLGILSAERFTKSGRNRTCRVFYNGREQAV